MLRLGLALILLGITASGAIAAQVTFKGTLHLTSITTVCADNGAVVGQFMRLLFSPPGLGDNGTRTRLSLFYGFGGAENYTLASGSLLGTAFQPVTITTVFRGSGQGTSQLRITSQIPAVPLATTTEIKIVGNIRDMSGDVGCNTSFIGNAFKE